MKSTKRIMKSKNEIEKICQNEVKEYFTKNYNDMVRNTSYQTIAVVMCVLNRKYGFGKTRLTRLKSDIEAEFVKMDHGILGREYTTGDCVKYLKENYDIDFSESDYTAKGWINDK